jgi:zinc transporter ZupT
LSTALQAFFFGIALCKVLDWIADSLTAFINRMSARQRRRQKHSPSSNDISASGIDEVQLCSSMHEAIHSRCSKDGSPPLSPKAAHHRHSVLISGDVETASSQCDLMSTGSAAEGAAGRRTSDDEPALAIITNAQLAATDEHDRNIAEAVGHLGEADCGHLVRTSILVWLALSLHNLPEGLATIVG